MEVGSSCLLLLRSNLPNSLSALNSHSLKDLEKRLFLGWTLTNISLRIGGAWTEFEAVKEKGMKVSAEKVPAQSLCNTS